MLALTICQMPFPETQVSRFQQSIDQRPRLHVGDSQHVVVTVSRIGNAVRGQAASSLMRLCTLLRIRMVSATRAVEARVNLLSRSRIKKASDSLALLPCSPPGCGPAGSPIPRSGSPWPLPRAAGWCRA